MKTNLVSIQDGKAVTSSLQVAEFFDKNHADVLRAIRSLDCSSKFQESNFACKFYISNIGNGAQKKNPMYLMTRDGFTMLVMGFTGKTAAKFKEDYINAFNEMEAELTKANVNNNDELRDAIDTIIFFCRNRNERLNNRYLDAIILITLEFIKEEMLCFCSTESRLKSKIEASRILFSDDRHRLQNMNYRR